MLCVLQLVTQMLTMLALTGLRLFATNLQQIDLTIYNNKVIICINKRTLMPAI